MKTDSFTHPLLGKFPTIEHTDADGLALAAMSSPVDDLLTISTGKGPDDEDVSVVSLRTAERRALAAFLLDGLPPEDVVDEAGDARRDHGTGGYL